MTLAQGLRPLAIIPVSLLSPASLHDNAIGKSSLLPSLFPSLPRAQSIFAYHTGSQSDLVTGVFLLRLPTPIPAPLVVRVALLWEDLHHLLITSDGQENKK